MAKAKVNGVLIDYEILGSGIPIALTPGGFRPSKGPMRRMAEQLSDKYQVLIYDRRNTGDSGISLADYDHEFAIWADDLYELLQHLDIDSYYVGGISGGFLLSMQFAQRHPHGLRGLILMFPPSPDLFPIVQKNEYLQPADLASGGKMDRVISDTPWKVRVEGKPELKEYLLSMDVNEFATTMRRWATFCETENPHFGGLTKEQIKNITVPALVIPGGEEGHPTEVGEQLHKMLFNSSISYASEDIWERFKEREAQKTQSSPPNVDDGPVARFMEEIAPFVDEFIQNVERKR